MALTIAVPAESRSGELRVAMVPACASRLLEAGHRVVIESGAGRTAGFADDDYLGVAFASDFASTVAGADIIVKVAPPTTEETSAIPSHALLVCIMSAFQHLPEVEALRARGCSVIALDHLPRVTRAQPMDALSSQATVAGYKAALLAAELSPRLFPMLSTAAGTIHPSRVLVIGAGVAGLQAIATARRLGARVSAYDVRVAAKEQIESTGAHVVDTGVEMVGKHGHARALRQDELQLQHDVLARHVADAHVVICAASIPGRSAPKIITEDMVDGMMLDTVIVDLAANTGGNCELTRPGEQIRHNDTLIVGPLNLPSHGAVHASETYSRNVLNMLEWVLKQGELRLSADDELISHSLLMSAGVVHHAATADLLGVEPVIFGEDDGRSQAEIGEASAGWIADADIADEPEEVAAASADTQPDGEVTEVRRQADGSVAEREGSVVPEKSPGSENAADTVAKPEAEAPSADMTTTPAVADTQAEPSPTTDAVGAPEQDTPLDDLTAIDGIGPAVQARLRDFGIERYEQLAELDEAGLQTLIEQVDLDLELLEKDWPAQAAALMKEAGR